MTISHLRRLLYRSAATLGDVQAVQKSIKTRSPQPVAKRVVRKAVYRTENKYTRRALRSLGL